MDNAEAYFILNLLPGIGPVRVAQLLTRFGEPAALLRAGREELLRVPGIGDRCADVLANWSAHCDPAAERELIARSGVQLLTRADADYPPLLAEIHDPPLCLYARGATSLLRDLRSAIAVVGSRHTTAYGVKVAECLATAAALAGWTVVSGLARGIDTVAHESTLRVDGRTIAVLGGGLGQIYPQDNADLARRIAARNGVLLSELPMLWRPDKRTFPMRNRIISGLCRGCIVVEAGTKSGALITAAQALDQNRQVFAVPGRIDSPLSRGCHALLRDGAKLVESFADVVEEFTVLPGLTPAADGPARPAADETSRADLQLSELERKLFDFMGVEELPIDQLIAGVGEPPARVLAALVALEMRRLVRQLPGKRVVRATATRGG